MTKHYLFPMQPTSNAITNSTKFLIEHFDDNKNPHQPAITFLLIVRCSSNRYAYT